MDLRTRVKKLGAKEKARRRRKCKVRFSIIKKNKAFQKNYMKSGCQEVAACRHDASKNMGSPCGWDVSHGEVEIEETVGGGGTWPGSGRGDLHHGHSVLGRRSMDREMESRAEISLDEADSRGSNVETGKMTSRSSDVRNP